jgi:hypothetical protein
MALRNTIADEIIVIIRDGLFAGGENLVSWETFDRKSKPRVNEKLVTLQAAGTFSMNEAAYEALGHPGQVDLLYAPENQMVGFRPAEGSPHSYPVKQQPNGRSFQTGGRAFCTHYGIETGQARRFAAELVDGVLAISLGDGGKEVGRSRKGEEH